jgi:hypothetical protein
VFSPCSDDAGSSIPVRTIHRAAPIFVHVVWRSEIREEDEASEGVTRFLDQVHMGIVLPPWATIVPAGMSASNSICALSFSGPMVHQHLIQNLRAMEWEEFVDHTLASKRESLKALSDQLRRLDAELAQRDLASVPTARLQSMAEQLRRRLDHVCGATLFSAGVELSRDDETRPAIQSWPA